MNGGVNIHWTGLLDWTTGLGNGLENDQLTHSNVLIGTSSSCSSNRYQSKTLVPYSSSAIALVPIRLLM